MWELNSINEVDALQGLQSMPDNLVQCCITSPPYWRQRDYQVEGQYGMEDTPGQYIRKLVDVFTEVRRILKPDGTLWLNIGDSYWGSGKAGNNPEYKNRHREFGKPSVHVHKYGKPVTGKHPELKPKDLIGLPWQLAFALRSSGWYLRQDIIWHKPNPIPESVKDRCTKSHEYIFLLSKSARYYYDSSAIAEDTIYKERRPGGMERNRLTGYDSKSNNHPVAYLQSVKRGGFNGKTNSLKGREAFRAVREKKNKRSVWSFPTRPLSEAHFAAFPLELPGLCILASSREGDIVLDPFMGAGTTALAAACLNRRYVGFELNPSYISIARQRITETLGVFVNQSLNI